MDEAKHLQEKIPQITCFLKWYLQSMLSAMAVLQQKEQQEN